MTTKSNGVLTRKSILQAAGEFDAESIEYLNYDNAQLENIEALREFKNLIHLNLSFNAISLLDVLRDLKSITHLNLSSNKVTNVDPLGHLEALEDLNLAGNLLNSTDRLRSLRNAATLKKLRLQDKIHNLTNPACRENGYQFNILEMLPQLIALDGERVKGRGSDLYNMCKDLDKQIENGTSFGPVVERPLPEPWFKENFFKFETKVEGKSKAEIEFEKALLECRKLDEAAARKLDKLKNP